MIAVSILTNLVAADGVGRFIFMSEKKSENTRRGQHPSDRSSLTRQMLQINISKVHPSATYPQI